MLIIRNLIYWFILSSSIILLFPFMLLALPFQGGAHKMAQIWVRILNWSLKHIIGLNYTLSGAENIPDHPAIICAKHQSGWETLALQEIFLPKWTRRDASRAMCMLLILLATASSISARDAPSARSSE